MTTMSHIYLVILSVRDCCSDHQTTLRAFSEKYEAESYMEGKVRDMARNQGLLDAVDRIMEATWDKTHIRPEYPSCGDESYEERRKEYDTYSDARCAEAERLQTMVGWEPALHERDEYHLWIKEVPFGFEVVKPATEEVAQAAE